MHAMASWLSGQQDRGRDSHDIRKYIRVHGRVLTPSSQTNSTVEQEDVDSDDFIMTSQQCRPRPTKQLTLIHFKRKQPPPLSSSDCIKEDRTQEKERNESESNAQQRLFLPASKFSTGVRRKATKEEANKENLQSQEAESPKKEASAVAGSPLRGLNHRSPCSVDKKPKRDQHYHSLSQLPTHKQGKRKRSEQKINEIVMESSDQFLSSRKRRAKDRDQLDEKASCEVKRVACPAADVGQWGHGDLRDSGSKLNDGQEGSKNEKKLGTLESSDSDVYINTDELLADLSNCEKNL